MYWCCLDRSHYRNEKRAIWTNKDNDLSFHIFCSVSDPDKRLQALWVVCDKLPKNNRTNLRLVKRKAMTAMPWVSWHGVSTCSLTPLFSCRYLMKFLSKLAQDSEENKMTPSNIAIVLGPNLLWAKTEGWEGIRRKGNITLLNTILHDSHWFKWEESN